jgi:hypothetical protein
MTASGGAMVLSTLPWQHETDVWSIFFNHTKRTIRVQYQALWIRRQVLFVRRDEWVLNGRSMMRFYKR